MPGNNTGGGISKTDASRIQSTQATAGRDMSSRGFAARAQSAADRATNNTGGGYQGGMGGNNAGGGGGARTGGGFGGFGGAKK